MTEPLQTTPRIPRSIWRYSLRTLLIVVTLICLGGGWYLGRVRNQQDDVHWVQQQGGKVYYRGCDREVLPPATKFEQWVVRDYSSYPLLEQKLLYLWTIVPYFRISESVPRNKHIRIPAKNSAVKMRSESWEGEAPAEQDAVTTIVNLG